MFRTLVNSDEAVKIVFDHFRNIGIAGAVFAAGIWVLAHPSTGLLSYMSFASGVSLCLMGLFLLFVAERHGYKKLQQANLPWYWEITVILMYGCALFSLFSIAALRVQIQ